MAGGEAGCRGSTSGDGAWAVGSRKSAASSGSGGGAGAAGSPEVRGWLWVPSGPLPGPAAEVRSIPASRAWPFPRGPGLCSPARPLSRCSRPRSCSTSCRRTQVPDRGRSAGRRRRGRPGARGARGRGVSCRGPRRVWRAARNAAARAEGRACQRRYRGAGARLGAPGDPRGPRRGLGCETRRAVGKAWRRVGSARGPREGPSPRWPRGGPGCVRGKYSGARRAAEARAGRGSQASARPSVRGWAEKRCAAAAARPVTSRDGGVPAGCGVGCAAGLCALVRGGDRWGGSQTPLLSLL